MEHVKVSSVGVPPGPAGAILPGSTTNTALSCKSLRRRESSLTAILHSCLEAPDPREACVVLSLRHLKKSFRPDPCCDGVGGELQRRRGGHSGTYVGVVGPECKRATPAYARDVEVQVLLRYEEVLSAVCWHFLELERCGGAHDPRPPFYLLREPAVGSGLSISTQTVCARY